jgi:hypothetical protein
MYALTITYLYLLPTLNKTPVQVIILFLLGVKVSLGKCINSTVGILNFMLSIQF